MGNDSKSATKDRDSEDSAHVVDLDDVADLQRPAKRAKGRARNTGDNDDEVRTTPKGFSVSEFARIIVLIRDDERAWEQWRVTLSGLNRTHASNRYTCADFWPIFLEPLYNDVEYDLERDFSGWIRCTNLNFNGRKRNGKELQKEFDTMKSLFSPIYVKYKTKTGVQDPSFRNFLKDSGYDMHSDFAQKLMVIAEVCDIGKKGLEDLTLISGLSRQLDDTGDAIEEGGLDGYNRSGSANRNGRRKSGGSDSVVDAAAKIADGMQAFGVQQAKSLKETLSTVFVSGERSSVATSNATSTLKSEVETCSMRKQLLTELMDARRMREECKDDDDKIHFHLHIKDIKEQLQLSLSKQNSDGNAGGRQES